MAKRKTLQELTLFSRFLFNETMAVPGNMQTVLEIILGKDIMLKSLPQTEKEQITSPVNRFVKLDVCAQDIDDTIYDTEVQHRNTHNLPKRSRYYQSMIDGNLLKPGTTVNFNDLNDVYIIVITPFDLFGKGRYCYTFSMNCKEESDIALEDGAVRIFINTNGEDDENITPELKELLYLIEHTNDDSKIYESERVRNLKESVRAIQKSEEVGVRFMQAWEEKIMDREEGRKEGREEGRKEGRAEGREEGRKEGREEGRKEGREEGREEGKTGNMVQNTSALMETMNMTADQAMDALKIFGDDRETVAALL